ncbi:MAG: NosL family protein [Deltaproteobacteria bacterium]|nr:NosL family protein [Deltaproteobacteria bacterium]
MKRMFVLAFAVSLVFTAASFLLANDDTKAHPTCIYCGMDRVKFAHSRMLITYDDGSTVAFCSLHCTAVDLALKIDKTPTSVMVGDYATKELIDAEKASWVLGGAKMGVMTKRAKWAFANKEGADAFMSANGGTLISFDDALKAAYEDMNADTKMIRDKRKMKRMQMQSGGMQKAH